MAYSKVLTRYRNLIFGIGLAFEIVAFLLRKRTMGLALAFFGLGICLLALHDLYQYSERKRKDNQLASRN